ncbi:MAG TPA: GNAT family N-acetyltransferase [Acidimicrobiales bacterium]|nr:GNAT family N-acetyltransferase [Acidimicrobiales bacterium]
MQLTARPADADDIPALAQLLSEASMAVATERGGLDFLAREGVAPPLEDQLELWLADPATYLVVGTAEGVTLAMALCRLETLRDGERLARLEFLWVDAGVRQIGLGAELMELVVDWAQDNGAGSLDAFALPGNRDAKNFLESAGFSARLLVMNRRLGDGPGRSRRPRPPQS